MAAASPYIRQEPGSNHLWVLVAFALIAFAAGLGYALAYGELQAFFLAASLVTSLAVLMDFRIGVVLLVVLLPLHGTQLFPFGLMGIPGLNPLNLLIVSTAAAYLLRGGSLARLVPRPLLWLLAAPIVVGGAMGLAHFDQIAGFFFDTDLAVFETRTGYLQLFAFRPLLIIAVAMLLAVAVAQSQKPERFLVPMMLAVWLMARPNSIHVGASGLIFGWFGYLPGDLRIERDAVRLFIPITSMILVSVVLTTFLRLVFFVLRRVF